MAKCSESRKGKRQSVAFRCNGNDYSYLRGNGNITVRKESTAKGQHIQLGTYNIAQHTWYDEKSGLSRAVKTFIEDLASRLN